MSQKVKFEKQMERLQKVVEDLEKAELSLEKSVQLYKEGLLLAASCREQLETARQAVTIRHENAVAPFDPMAEDDEDKK